jgi:alpha-methylacyl-CoA racemase
MGPLSGLRVIELAGIGPAPFCGMLLADMGADVTLIDRQSMQGEPPAIAAFAPGPDSVARRGKRSVALNLRTPPGVQVLLKMISVADVLIEGYRPGVMERLGLGPEVCLERNPRLVYGRMTGWGQHGPLSKAAGHDLNFVALSGALEAGARPGAPPWTPPSVIGDMGGGMLLAFGVACAVLESRGSGKGQVIDAAMIDAAALMAQGLYSLHAAGHWGSPPGTRLLDSGAPFYDTYQCSDGEWVTLAALEPPFYRQMLQKLGLADDPLFAEQFDTARWPECKRRVADVIRSKTREEWRQELEGTDVCFAPVLGIDEAPRHPHNQARGVFEEKEGLVQPAPAPRFSRTPGAIRSAPAAPGSGCDQALSEYGFSEREVQQLRGAGVISP